MGSVHSNQLMTMGGPTLAGLGQSSGPTYEAAEDLQQSNPRMYSMQTNADGQGGATTHGSINETNNQIGDQINQKASMIQMRKINPISKTAVTGSKNTSIDRKNNLIANMRQNDANSTGK